MAKSTTAKRSGKSARPPKPYPDFPLFPHASGRWAKKIRGQFEYFGSWVEDPTGEAAGKLWVEQREDLLAGRRPRQVSTAGVTVKVLCDSFLTAKEQLVQTGELTQRSFQDYFATCKRLADAFGRGRPVDDLASDDFRELRAALGKTWGPVAIGNEIGRVRVVFRWGYESGVMDRPVRYGADFKRPSRKTLRQVRAAKGPRLFSAPELRKLIDSAGAQIKAMLLLGINCGLGNSDCANLEFRHLDLKAGWLDFPRPKTGIQRRCPLWPETVKALKAAIAERHEPADGAYAQRVFITKYGRPWLTDGSRNSPLSHELAKVLDELEMSRAGRNFYSLRHTFETVGGEAKDQPAVDAIMGHAPDASDMAAVYREGVSDDRLLAVSNHVRAWLFRAKRRAK